MRLIFPLSNVPDECKNRIGGKALSLNLLLTDLKVNVPDGYVIIADAFNRDGIKSEAIHECEQMIASLDKSVTYAVRSSALNEDGKVTSFAGQYETLTDVKAKDIMKAINEVAKSQNDSRVTEYTENFHENNKGIAVVIQRFVRPEFAGVIFTADPITGKDEYIIGNYVKGAGEQLVSGQSNANEFKINAIKYSYEGNKEICGYAKKLASYSLQIRECYKMPMDIEWAISGRKVYILQSRPITTLNRTDMTSYKVNGSLSSYKLLTRTNVGEIFMKPVSPMTFSALEKINNALGFPDWLDNICGQPYMNISVMCSIMVSFGMSRETAFEKIKDLVGNVPEGIVVPISPFHKNKWLKHIKTLFFPRNKCKLSRKEKHEMVLRLPEICRELICHIKKLDTNKDLEEFWKNIITPKLSEALSSIMNESGINVIPLFTTRNKITKVAGAEMANRLCGGSLGVIDCMKPLLLIEDVAEGTLSPEDYMNICGHRAVNEMELMQPRPYEKKGYLDNLIQEYKVNHKSLRDMIKGQETAYQEALAEFIKLHPDKRQWILKTMSKFSEANRCREDLRSKGVWIFGVLREYLLAIGRINGIEDDIFMLTMDEAFELIKGNSEATKYILPRKDMFEKYQSYPTFPSLILGRFEPEKWLEHPNRRADFYCDQQEKESGDGDLVTRVKGFAGAAGTVEGTVRIVTDIDNIDEIRQGDILVTTATNIGWTLIFPKVAAIITDIGAPLSHAAIVAREFGIPAVVGCGNATSILKTGDKVLVDGAKGTVCILED